MDRRCLARCLAIDSRPRCGGCVIEPAYTVWVRLATLLLVQQGAHLPEPSGGPRDWLTERLGRGTACRAPTRGVLPKNEDAVQVVRHDREDIQLHHGIMAGDLAPTVFDNLAVVIEPHHAADDLTEHRRLWPGADGHGVGPGLGVVELRQSDGSALLGSVSSHRLSSALRRMRHRTRIYRLGAPGGWLTVAVGAS